MYRKSLVFTVVMGLSLACLATDVFAQRGGRGRGGPGGESNDKSRQSMDDSQTPGPRRGRGGGGQSVNPLFAALDANGDGVIAMVEMENAIQVFAKLDENKDGKLSADEVGRQGRGGQGRGMGRGGAADGSESPAAGRGGQGRRGDNDTPGAGRGGRGKRGGAIEDVPEGKPGPATKGGGRGNSKSPFDR